MSALTKALFAAAGTLARYPACRYDQPGYGPAKCRVHRDGTHYAHETQPWCSKAAEGPLREALANLLDAMDVEILDGGR